MDTLECKVDKIVYRSPENGFTILSCFANREMVTVTGPLADVHPGVTLSVQGEWKTHPKYGQQLEAASWTYTAPSDLAGIELYLTHFCKGIGKTYARKIVQQFGRKAIEVLDSHPEKLSLIRGIGKGRLKKIQDSWKKHKAIQDVMIFLQGHGITPGYAARIYAKYGDTSIAVIKKDPYRLADEVRGIGFQMADKLALNLGIDQDSFIRIRSGVLFTLNQVSNDGHVYATRGQLVRKAISLLDVDEVKLQATIDEMLKTEEVVKDGDDAIFLPQLRYCEVGIASNMARLLTTPKKLKADVSKIEKKLGITYDPLQADAIMKAMESQVMVLTGGPGTGKTTVTRGIIEAFLQNRLKVALAAPTGRAAKRMQEATEMEAKTIHRLLEFRPDVGFVHDRDDPLDAQAVIADESSMIDTYLMNAMLRALKTGTRLILIGDIDQLPSVGAGNVLRDIIDSETVPTVRLTKIFRQALTSKIIENCHLVNDGHMPDIKVKKEADFFFVKAEDKDNIPGLIEDLVSRRLPAAYKVKTSDIQVLCPQKTSDIGTYALNKRLQKALNPATIFVQYGDTTFKVGDRVMQMSNNYDKGVFNGDVGTILSIDRDEDEIKIAFDGNLVTYSTSELGEISLSYAATIHKSQGSEYPVVVIPIHNTNHIMLERHLIYTGFSRAKKLLVVVGSEKALQYAVSHEVTTKRNTMLKERLRAKILGDPDPSAPAVEVQETVPGWTPALEGGVGA